MSSLLHRINSTGNIKLSLTDDGALNVTSSQPLSEKQAKWLSDHEAEIQKELVATYIHQVDYPNGFGALIMSHNSLWDFMDALADMAYENGGQWQQALNGLVWWLSICVDDKAMTINQLRVELGVMPRFFLHEHALDERKWFAELTASFSHSQLKEVSQLYNHTFKLVFNENMHMPVKRENLARRAANVSIAEHINSSHSQRDKSIAEMRAILSKY